MPTATGELTRNLIAFWLLGLCNNFAYVIMLSAAKDILEKDDHGKVLNGTDECVPDISAIPCSPISTGSILLADILPTLFVKLVAPFTLQGIPHSVRHVVVVLLQALSFIIVATSNSVSMGIVGVVFASFGSGLGEVTYLTLATYFHSDVVSSYASGTGGAGLFGAFTYAILTDRKFIGLTPKSALLSMLIVPVIFALSFGNILQSPPTVRTWRAILRRPVRVRSASGSLHDSDDELADDNEADSAPLLDPASTPPRRPSIAPVLSFRSRLLLIKPLLKYVLPLTTVYFAEYFINQGLIELVTFDCAHGWGLSPSSQYRWYQVLYQLGVFVSRSSSKLFPLHSRVLPILAALQLLNAALFFRDASTRFIPHIAIVFGLIVYEGLLGGAAYVNTFRAVHKSISEGAREFSMSFVLISDSIGIVIAGMIAIPVHNYICHRR
uniref:Battenin n=1 Tax=Panagrellus redivivus TaxID=6233 RepID=A0A7E4UQF1_PANRE